ncbi:helix-turn-helix domain-containing protein [Spongiibacter tropicus]|uniref:helix-turn-helix domain-containing protein n=1 Tax=Spongiibacter tropicus TaxID=454602 RepID=UPI0035BE402D
MSDKRLKALGETIRQERKNRGISQEELANKAQLDRSYMGRIERGEKNITVLKLLQICDALKISPSLLFKN